MATWVAFALTVFLFSALPGPNITYALNQGLQFGFRGAVRGCSGSMFGLGLLILGYALGLAALLREHAGVIPLMQLLGGLYLGWLAWRSIKPARGGQIEVAETPSGRATSQARTRSRFRDGLSVALSNPKVLLFIASVFPGFLLANREAGPQLLVLGITWVTIDFIWQLTYAGAAGSLRRWLYSPRGRTLVSVGTASLFGFWAASLIVEALADILPAG